MHTSHASIVSRIAHRVYEQEPPLSPAGAWWHALEPNFFRVQEPFLLARREQLQIGAVAMLDVGVRTAVASVVAASGIGRALKMSEVRRDIEESQMYARLLDAGRALELYPHPAPNLAFHERAPKPPYYRPTMGRCVDLAWESQFTPYAPGIRERYLSHTENLVARARYFRHDGAARPTIVLLHGFAAEAHAFNERLFQVRWLYERLGLDVVCLTLPFHGSRRGRGSAYTGQRFISEGMCWIAEAFRQTVLDFRALLNFLMHTRGAPAVGVSGVSLGGYTAGLLASIEPRLSFAIPNVPVVSLPDALLEWNPAGALMRAAMFATKLSLQEVRHRMAVHSPLSFHPLIPKDRLMVIGGVGDRLAPPKHARLLWDHWGRPFIHWFPGNHLVHLDQREYLRYMAKFLARIGFLPPRATDEGPRVQTAIPRRRAV